MWLAGEVFPRAWKLLGCGLACFRGCLAVLLVGSLFAIAWESRLVRWCCAAVCTVLCMVDASARLRHFQTRA
jgi:uncharacterized membrane protein